MGAVASIADLLAEQRVWRGQPARLTPGQHPTGLEALDAALPAGGWPEAALSEILLPADGMGEIQLLLPTLARLTRANRHVVLVSPPYVPYAPAWHAAGVDLTRLGIVTAPAHDAAWAMEQALRSGGCGAVLGWLRHADDRSLRRLQVAAGTGNALGFVFRDRAALANPSPAALRLEVGVGQIHVRKCRGSNPPPAVAFARTEA